MCINRSIFAYSMALVTVNIDKIVKVTSASSYVLYIIISGNVAHIKRKQTGRNRQEHINKLIYM